MPPLIATIASTLAGLAFAALLLVVTGPTTAGQYLSAFVLEKSLSLDNVAMFAAVLGAASLPTRTARRVLTGGLLGALALRIVFILAGLAVVDAVRSAMLGFAVILVASGVHMLRARETSPAGPATGPRWLPDRIRRRPALLAFAAILVIDVAFAADSILAAFAVTTNAFPIIAANVFAVLGLRPLYEVLRDAIDRFRYLRGGIGVLLLAVGIELGLEDFVNIPSWVTLVAVVCCLGGSILASWFVERGVSLRRACRVVAVSVTGVALLAVGAAMLVLPGPGLLVIVLGLAVLAKEYDWARRPLDAVRRRLRRRSSPS